MAFFCGRCGGWAVEDALRGAIARLASELERCIDEKLTQSVDDPVSSSTCRVCGGVPMLMEIRFPRERGWRVGGMFPPCSVWKLQGVMEIYSNPEVWDTWGLCIM